MKLKPLNKQTKITTEKLEDWIDPESKSILHISGTDYLEFDFSDVTEIDVEEISKFQFDSLSEKLFSFKKQVRRRNVPLNQVLPTNLGWKYGVIITNALVSVEEDFFSISCFDNLWKILSLNGDLDCFVNSVKNNSRISEGTTRFSEGISEFLIKNAASKFALIKNFYDPDHEYWRVSLIKLFGARHMLYCLPQVFGEYWIFDEGGNWFIFLSDDSPFVFIACSDLMMDQLLNERFSFVMEVPGDFEL
jgi:hypothetical protein